MGLSVLGWSEPAGEKAGRPAAGADAGGLRGASRWKPPVVELSAQLGREPGGLGRSAAGSLSARAGRQEPEADGERWMRRTGGVESDGLPAGATSNLLGTPRAPHFSETSPLRPPFREGPGPVNLTRARSPNTR